MRAKIISNIIKLLIVCFIFYEYDYQSKMQGEPLSADSCKGLLFIAIAGFLILLPIDGSLFIKNFYNAKGYLNNDDSKRDIKNNNE